TADAEHTVTYTPDSKSTTVQFVDDDAAEQPVGDPIAVAGVTNGTKSYDVTSQIPARYVLAADNSATGSVQFSATGADPIEIHLKHGTTVIGSADQDATAVKPLKLTQNYTQTIHYQYADHYKPTADVTQTATSTRTATVDNVTGQVVSYSDWINGNYAAVATPAVAGYTADVPEVAAATNVTADAEHTVTYTPDSKSTTVQFIDDDAAEQPVGDPIAVTGVTNGTKSYDVTGQIPAGYVLAAGNSATGSVQFTATGADPIEIHLKHGTTVIGSGDQDATAVKPSDLTQNYTQTVHFVFADGRKAKDDTTQTATSTRTATIDNVTNAVLGYSDWTNGDFAAVPVPAIKGYTANVDEIPAQSDVTADAEYTVTYTADPVKDRGTLPVTGGQSGQGTGSQTGSQTGAGASTGAAAESSRNQANAGTTGATTANLTNQSATATATHGTLPSTGEVEARAALSLGIVTLMSTLALAGASRKRAH
ncbi:mucin-binding protein, partial [Lacticaseibacillus nasuensis]|uniref:mucin-binding protein n=1 Tax=Lacticaseibacillus nasuensis TaxID=944671 RepID=UPI00192CF172